MGFGFSLLVLFILLPATAILLLLWMLSGRKEFGGALGLIWGGILALVLLSVILRPFTTQKKLSKKDFYGNYVVDRDFFPGRQADWQYNRFRFSIKKNDSIYLHVTDKRRILKTYRGHISTLDHYASARPVVEITPPTHHIVASSLTIYRSVWSFYLVFSSSKFGNVFFRKEKWKAIEK